MRRVQEDKQQLLWVELEEKEQVQQASTCSVVAAPSCQGSATWQPCTSHNNSPDDLARCT